MACPALRIEVTTKDQKVLRKLWSGGVQQVRVVLRAVALLQMAKGVSAPRVAAVVPLTPQAIRKVSHRYQQGGLERALYEKERRDHSAGGQPEAAHHCHGLQRSAGGSRPVDRATGSRGSREETTGSASGKGNHPGFAAPPRPQAVAGKKSGAWANQITHHTTKSTNFLD